MNLQRVGLGKGLAAEGGRFKKSNNTHKDGPRKKNNMNTNLRTTNRHASIALVAAFTLALAAGTANAQSNPYRDKGKELGRVTQEQANRAIENAKQCAKDARDGYKTMEIRKEICNDVGANTRRAVEIGKGFLDSFRKR